MKLLLAEDERELSSALTAILKHNNYTVDAVYNGNEALDYALAGEYDGIILDIMMPGQSGLSVLKRLRESGSCAPVLMLTAKGEVEDRVCGLDLGADDYLTKPFDMRELLARIRAMTRRKPEVESNLLTFGGLRLSRSAFELSSERVPEGFRLANKEFQMMEMLMSGPGRLISTGQFMERIWGYDSESEINVVWVCVSNLRKKLAALDCGVTIRAQRGAGYALEEIHD